MSKDHSIVKHATVEKTVEEDRQKFLIEIETGFSDEELKWLELVDRLAEFDIFESVDEAIKGAISNALMELISRARKFVPDAQALARKPLSEQKLWVGGKKKKQMVSSGEDEKDD